MFNRKKDKNTKKENKPINDFVESAPNQEHMQGEDGVSLNLREILSDGKTKQIIGLSIIVFSVYAVLSYVSYWINTFSGSSDQALIIGKSWNWLQVNHKVSVHNFMGILGARISYLVVYRWFGIVAIFPLLVLLHYGIKLFTGKYFLNQRKLFIITIFLLLWGTIAFGLISPSSFFLGGGIGYFGYLWLKGLLGLVGTVILVLFSAFLFLVSYLNLNLLPSIGSKANKKENTVVNADGKIPVAEVDETNDDEIPSQVTFSDETEEENETEQEDDGKLKIINLGEDSDEDEIEEDKEETEEEIKGDNEEDDDIPFEIEKVEEDPEEHEKETYDDYEDDGLSDEYDPRLDLPGYQFPTSELLKVYEIDKAEIDHEELQASKKLIVDTLENYKIGIKEIKATIGPTVTLYEIVPEVGVRIAKIKNLEDDIALSLAALGIRIIAPIPGRGTIGIEVPNKNPEMVPMSSVIKSKKFQESKFELPVILGKTISNEIYIADLAKMPHLLVAGATGQGKSVGLNCLIVSLLYKKHPTELKFVLVDPKKVELSLYSRLEKHFLAKIPGRDDAIITDTSQVTETLQSLTIEMDTRYDLLKEAGCRNIIEYNNKFKSRKLNPEKGHRFLPYIVVIIDEVADLMMTAGREVETPIARIAQLARAVGIHVILATQRPSVNIITGTIKANFPARLAFRVTSKIDSRTILDGNGADQLIGKGDMLFYSGSDLVRLQCPFVDTPEADAVVEFISQQRNLGEAFELPEAPGEEGNRDGFDASDRDEMFEEAARIVVETQQGSTSMIQRKLKLGYNRAGRIIDQLEAVGIVGPSRGSKARDVLIPDLDSLEHFLDSLGLDN